ncbi:sigma-54 dependent transcriptional regulator [Pelagicoccus sp. SDUM812002]|uniref:sigma-54-dependent transcriptional regulator n=1 Tax=Pelagicoccus sp. SDUM812002 TaxID=3041266 RepID=UPI00280F03FE|nr:sigma-54 dependent transcriptional regulator [Pelagicoccus sp. SDUM812002]MDQ8184818.1 sigma-54 dependent transcriptional regulator [Pelagicoccus sp. SDUM812002]
MPNSSNRILIADDNKDVLQAIRLALKSEGYQADCVQSPADALKRIEQNEYATAIIDLNYHLDTTSGQEGIELLGKIREKEPDLPVVIMTAWASIDVAVECMRNGANDFLQKPWDDERLIAIVRSQLRLNRAQQESQLLKEENRTLRKSKASGFIAQSRAMRPVLDLIESVADSDASILITGENGTGKGVIANLIHQHSGRAEHPFISVNMGGIPDGVFESELFGHVKGAFTDAKENRIGRFELAASGTLFLDEVANMPTAQQQKLLRALETREFERVGSSRTQKFDARLVVATNADLQAEVDQGRFRMDLLYRLNTITIHLPPLRERVEDIGPLAEFFLSRYSKKYRKEGLTFATPALETMKAYEWPGNIRELDHCLERAVLTCREQEIGVPELGLRASTASPTSSNLDEMSLEEVESYLIRRTLSRCGGKANEAAQELGLSRSAFYRRMQRYGL